MATIKRKHPFEELDPTRALLPQNEWMEPTHLPTKATINPFKFQSIPEDFHLPRKDVHQSLPCRHALLTVIQVRAIWMRSMQENCSRKTPPLDVDPHSKSGPPRAPISAVEVWKIEKYPQRIENHRPRGDPSPPNEPRKKALKV